MRTEKSLIGKSAFTGADAAGAATNGFHYGLFFTLALVIVGFILAFKLNNYVITYIKDRVGSYNSIESRVAKW